jgi:hypothetical protein
MIYFFSIAGCSSMFFIQDIPSDIQRRSRHTVFVIKTGITPDNRPLRAADGCLNIIDRRLGDVV